MNEDSLNHPIKNEESPSGGFFCCYRISEFLCSRGKKEAFLEDVSCFDVDSLVHPY